MRDIGEFEKTRQKEHMVARIRSFTEVTVRSENELHVAFEIGDIVALGDRLVLQGSVRLELSMPRQDARLPWQVEQAVEDAGQPFKRWAYRQLMEKLDAGLLLATRQWNVF